MLFDLEVHQAAAHWGPVYGVTVPPSLVHAILERESRHGQDARYIAHGGIVPEPGGHVSYGPMQVYDDTARTVLKLPFSPDALATNPQLGIWYGTKYLASLLKRFNGDVLAAASAYNAGPGNARRDSAGKFPNQAYVAAVQSFLNQYGGAAASSLPVLLVLGLGLWLVARRRR